MNLLHYILSEVKAGRLPKSDAIGLIQQYQSQNAWSRLLPLHPLVHQNTSDLSEQRFSTVLNGDEIFLTDHRVQGQAVLPGPAFLEMARAAAEQVGLGSATEHVSLRHVVFLRPVAVSQQPVRVHVRLFPREAGEEIGFEVYSGGADPVLHCQGAVSRTVHEDGAAARLDLAALQASCTRPVLSAAQCYQAFAAQGLDCGPGHRTLQDIYVADSQVLARLELPSAVAGSTDQFILHPLLLDGALQASAALRAGDDTLAPVLPLAIDEGQVLAPCTRRMWSLVRRSAGCSAVDRVQKLDIDLSDDLGRLCARLRGVSVRCLRREEPTAEARAFLVQPHWRPVQPEDLEVSEPAADAQRLVVLCGWPQAVAEGLQRLCGVCCVALPLQPEPVALGVQAQTRQLLELIRSSTLPPESEAPVLVQLVVPALGEAQLLAGLGGLLQTASHHDPRLRGQLIELDVLESGQGLLDKLDQCRRQPGLAVLRCQDGDLWAQAWKEIAPGEQGGVPWKSEGVYLVVGSTSDSGLGWDEAIARRAPGARLVFARAAGSALDVVAVRDAAVRHVNFTDRAQVEALLQATVQAQGRLDGIVYGPGVASADHTDLDALQQAMPRQAAALANLDEASKDLPLDCFVVLSTTAEQTHNFPDRYVRYRNTLAAMQQRHGRALSITGSLDATCGEAMADVLDQAWASGADQLQVVRAVQAASSPPSPVTPLAKVPPADLEALVKNLLVTGMSQILKLAPEAIDCDVELSSYGFDSLTIVQFASILRQDYQLDLAPTVFLVHSTVNQFAKYLAQEHGSSFAAKFAADGVASSAPQVLGVHPMLAPWGEARPALQGRDRWAAAPPPRAEIEGLFADQLAQAQTTGEERSRTMLLSALAEEMVAVAISPALSPADLTDDDKAALWACATQAQVSLRGAVDGLARALVERRARPAASVGLRMMTIPGSVPMSVALYYPSVTPPASLSLGQFAFQAAVNGEATIALKGLLVISHGVAGNEFVHYNLAQRLAMEGYLVAAPQHPGDNLQEHGLLLSGSYFLERPAQLSRVLDAVLADPRWHGRFDPSCIGAIGHSAGGFCVLSLLGGVANPLKLAAHLAQNRDDHLVSQLGGSIRMDGGELPLPVGLVLPKPRELRDPRVRAAVVMAPFAVVFDEPSLQRIEAPLKIYTAEHDGILNEKYHGGWLKEELPHAEFEQVKDIAHLAFMAPAKAAEPGKLQQLHRRLGDEIAAFFVQHLHEATSASLPS
jgi:predicted dienelactone hydrolase